MKKQFDESSISGLSERIARLEEQFCILNAFVEEKGGRVLHFQDKRDLEEAMAILEYVDPVGYNQYYFQNGMEPDFTLNGFLCQNAAQKVTATELIPALKVLLKICADGSLRDDLLILGGEAICKERKVAQKELRAIKNEWKEVLANME